MRIVEDLESDEEEALSCLAVAALAAFVVLELGAGETYYNHKNCHLQA